MMQRLQVDLPALPSKLSYLRCTWADPDGRNSRDCKPFNLGASPSDTPYRDGTDPNTYVAK